MLSPLDHPAIKEQLEPLDHKGSKDLPVNLARKATEVRKDVTVCPERRVCPVLQVDTSWFHSVSLHQEARRDLEPTPRPKFKLN
jgi:hypothetical protein